MRRIIAIIAVVVLSLSICSGCLFNRGLTAEVGEPANGFLWANNYSEITITGYEGSSNDLKIPDKINDKPVTLITAGAFKDFTALKSVEIPGGVVDITGAFEGCTELEKVTIGDGVENISVAFRGCTALKEISIPQSVTNMKSAFAGCTSLVNVNIPEGITSLDSTFSGCTALKNVEIPSSVTSLYRTFSDCTSLVSVEVPENVVEMEETFSGCKSLVNVNIPKGVTNLARAFRYCEAVKIITVPNGVVSFGREDVEGCISLESITIPESVGNDDFSLSGLVSIKNLEVPERMLSTIIMESIETTRTLSNDTTQSWYKELYKIAKNVTSYRYYFEELDDGTEYLQLVRDNKTGKEIEPYVAEPEVVGLSTYKREYYAALMNQDDSPAVVCVTTIFTKCVPVSFEMYSDELDTYQKITYKNKTVTINGKEYMLGYPEGAIE